MSRVDKILLICTLLFVFLVFLTGCTSPDTDGSTIDNRFVGNWTSDQLLGLNVNFEFTDDGKITIEGEVTRTGTWSVQGYKLIMSLEDEAEGFVFSGEYNFEFTEYDTNLELVYKSVVINLTKT